MNIEEAWAALCDIHREGGIVGHDSPHENKHRPCPACEGVRTAMLTVLDEVEVSKDLSSIMRRDHVFNHGVRLLREAIEKLGA